MNDASTLFRDATVADMMEARDRRAEAQRALLAAHGGPVVSMTLNIAGPRKVSPLTLRAFAEAVRMVEGQLARHALPVLARQRTRAHTGEEALWAVRGDARHIKERLAVLEEQEAIGRLLDIDVLGMDGQKIPREAVGLAPRRCLLCEREAMRCARSRAHSVAALTEETERILGIYLDARFADLVSTCAVRSLLEEVAITPKPGLVDRDNQGAHRDMDLFSFLDSASTLAPYFRQCTVLGMRAEGLATLFARLRYPGMVAEGQMLEATGGANTHKGAIFSLGILCAAYGYLYQGKGGMTAADACACAAEMTAQTLRGELAHTKGVAGARGEAMAGFPSAITIGIPALRRAQGTGASRNDAGVYALIALMAGVEDANIIRRSSPARAAALMQEAAQVRDAFSIESVRAMDARLIAENLSPGGCADLLAISLFLCAMEDQTKNDRET